MRKTIAVFILAIAGVLASSPTWAAAPGKPGPSGRGLGNRLYWRLEM